MANTKKQDKPTPVPEQAATAPADRATNSVPSGSDTSGADAAAGGVAVTVPGAEPVANTVQEASGPAAELPVELPPVGTSAEGAPGTGVSPNQPGQAGDVLHAAADMAGLEGLTSSAPGEVNTAQVKVYPLRSFMDEGELRRRGGPSYLVPRLHAEDLERRNLVSRTPLEE
ncbi:hypothetical protein [Pseudomonas parafulva]|uniref:hypothetical protein n=1 Tax=Pseudomonas parafulva TaxID=157782 RepID=UPI000734F1FA|nr:hypothetical protein [Pseudomonas parafulva]KTS98337.1 hypothetical protein NS212_08895 [Pseudomonas parafulva]